MLSPILNGDLVVVFVVIGGGVVISIIFKCDNNTIYPIKDRDNFRI